MEQISLFDRREETVPLAGRLRLLFALDRGLFISLSLADLLDHAGPGALLFEAAKRTVQGLIFLEPNLSHLFPSHPPSGMGRFVANTT